MYLKRIVVFLSCIFMASGLTCCLPACNGNSNSNNVQLSEEEKILMMAKDTAIKQYGERVIEDELPLVAKKKNDSIWVVEGTLPDGYLGGTVYIEILRDSMKVVSMTHYK